MNKFLMISIKTLTGVIVAVGGAYIAYEILKKYLNTTEPDVRQQPIPPISNPPIKRDEAPSSAKKTLTSVLSSNDKIYLSLVNGYLNKYQLNPKDSYSFFHLVTNIKTDGSLSFLNQLNQLMDEKIPVDQLLEKYKDLCSRDVPTGIEAQPEVETSPVIPKNSVKEYLEEYGLQDMADQDFRAAVLSLLEKAFNNGRKTSGKDFEVNFNWLEKYVANDDQTKIDKEIINIKSKIREEEELLS